MHAAVHIHDNRGPFQCHKCDEYFADLYLLASHIDRCEATGRAAFPLTCQRLELNGGRDAPTVIMVARSSGKPTKSWFASLEFIEEGLLVFGAERIKDYELEFGQEKLNTLSHAASSVSSRTMPAPQGRNSTSMASVSMQKNLGRAWKFTSAIKQDLETLAAMYASRKPTLISVGLDGFACHLPLLPAFFKAGTGILLDHPRSTSCAMRADFTTEHSNPMTYSQP
jgi:hypothetical protein